MIDIDGLRATALRREPFDWGLIESAFVSRAHAAELAESFPHDGFWTFRWSEGRERIRWAARPLVVLGAGGAPAASHLPRAWREVVADLLSDEYRTALAELTGRDLERAPIEVTLRRFARNAALGPHRDNEQKIVSQVFYFDAHWDRTAGGALNILGSADETDVVAELPPTLGSASVIVRSERSWHAVAPLGVGAAGPRCTLNVSFCVPRSESPAWVVGGDGAVRARDGVRETSPLHPRALAYELRFRAGVARGRLSRSLRA